jgi:hypothetical protein
LPGNMSRVKRALAQPHGRVDLVTWAAHTRKIYSNDPFDPRSSEWTALEVLRQVLRAIEAFRRHRTDLCHPTNYTVPVSWLDLPQDPWNRSSQIWTWESWRSFSCGEQCIEPRGRQSLISDYRYKQGADAKADDALRSELIAYGLLLFGLLRKSFEWPALWNVRGQERSHVWLASTESHRLPISSETLSILDALLKPRSWETYLLFSLAPGFTGVSNAGDVLKRMVSDTDLDVTPLTTPKQIQDAIRKAQRTLERGQIAGFANRPRQLVPVSIRHLTNAAIAGEQTNEED